MPRQVKLLFRDYRDSWTSAIGAERARARRRAAAFLYLTPTIGAAAFVYFHVAVPSTTPFLTALSVFTALLFGLLILVFNTAVTLRKDGASIANAHRLTDVIADLRATITYSIVVAVILVITLAVATEFMAPVNPKKPSEGSLLPWQWTPALVWLALHLLLNVGKILERIRTAFNYVSR